MTPAQRVVDLIGSTVAPDDAAALVMLIAGAGIGFVRLIWRGRAKRRGLRPHRGRAR